MGILADAVSQVIDLKPEEIEAPPAFGTRVKIDYLVGMGRSGKKFCLILDSEKVLSTDELLEVTDSLSSQEVANTDSTPALPTQEPETVLEA
jgi:purine-binding chemotaxis protein CheW